MYFPFDMRIIRRNETGYPEFTIDADGEKVAMGGRIWHVDRLLTDPDTLQAIPRNVVGVQFRLGNVTKSGSTTLTVSMQRMNVSPSSQQPRPNETVVSSVTIPNSSLVSNAWINAQFSSPVETFYTEKWCVVIEYGTFTSGNSIGIVGQPAVQEQILTSWVSRKLGGTWIPESSWPVLVLEFDDGKYGILEGALVTTGDDLLTFGSTSTPDEHGLQFQVDTTWGIDGLCAWIGGDAGYDLCLYSGTDLLRSVSIARYATPTTLGIQEVCISEDTLTPGVNYVISCKPHSSQTVDLVYDTVNAAAHKVLRGGSSLLHVARTDGGAWSTVSTTQIPYLGFRVDGWED